MSYTSMDMTAVELEVREAQTAVKGLLDNEERATERLSEIGAIENPMDRLAAAADLAVECSALAKLAKEMQEVAKRAKDRMAGVEALIKAGMLEEARDFVDEKGKLEVGDHKLAIRENPPKVVVDNLEEVARKYRLEPKPIPPVEEWPVDKNAVKQALLKEKVGTIKGIHLEITERIEIKPR